jgi:hypothetical protein
MERNRMSTDWSSVLGDAIDAARSALAEAWGVAAAAAPIQIAALTQTAQYIAGQRQNMSNDESALLMQQSQQALHNMLTAYEAISDAAAQRAVAAVVGVIVTAVPALLPFA